MIIDPVSDMLTRIRNAQLVRKLDVRMPHSKFKEAIARILLREGYLEDVSVEEGNEHKLLLIGLKYHLGRPVIDVIRRVSKPSLRRYVSKDELPRVMGGLGTAIVSTSKGLLSDKEARAAGVGGEIVLSVQ